MNKEELLARCEELQIVVPEGGATNDELGDLIKIAEHPLLKKAAEDADEERDELKLQLDAANERIEALEKEAGKNSPSDLKVLATYKSKDGDKFGLTNDSVRFKGEILKAEEAVKNEDLMEAMIANESVHLKKL